MGHDVKWSGPGVTFQVTGLDRTLRALDAAGVSAQDMHELMHTLGETVAHAAVPRTPERTGRLRRSITAGRGKTKAVVRAGGPSLPYAGVIHYGWPRHHIAPHPFLVQALDAERGEVFQELVDGLAQILREHDLK